MNGGTRTAYAIHSIVEVPVDIVEKVKRPAEAGIGEIRVPARLLAYSGLFEGVPVYAPYMEQFYLVSR